LQNYKITEKNFLQTIDISRDESDGYYRFTSGEILDSQYEIIAAYGYGVFSTVLRVRDLQQSLWVKTSVELAVKIIRTNEAVSKTAQLERTILNKLTLTDPKDKCHIIKLIGHFKHQNHVCLVLEPMNMNLRTCIKKFGWGVGLNLFAVHSFTIQLFTALKHLKHNCIIHADIKPDNVLVDKSRTIIKLCDFGSAMFSGHNDLTPYLVSRFYRAPEIILGLPYDTPIDIWSTACVIYELFTGKTLFPGKTNKEMIRYFIDTKGRYIFSASMIITK
jgi:serine/threonine-protein kinase PRP4